MNKADVNLVEKAKASHLPRAYDVGAVTMLELCGAYNGAPMELFRLAYVMGYIKGQNAAKNEHRRAAK